MRPSIATRIPRFDEAIRRDVHFIERHPTTLFRCLFIHGLGEERLMEAGRRRVGRAWHRLAAFRRRRKIVCRWLKRYLGRNGLSVAWSADDSRLVAGGVGGSV